MSYKSWNDYFMNFHDDRKSSHSSRGLMEDIDRFEEEYKNRFGAYIDHHALELTRKYGSKRAWQIIDGNIETLNSEKLAAAETEKMQYEFHDVPLDVIIPF